MTTINLALIPIETLEKDLLESKEDILVCQQALDLGITNYSGGSIKDRLEDNKRFIEIITKELDRRVKENDSTIGKV
jgi:hypothetical protein